MSTERVLESVIVADCGAGTTRAILVEAIDDVYRFIASAERPSTFEPPIDDLSVGVREALGALELATARRFLERNRPIMPQEGSGNGADALLTTMVSMPAVLFIGEERWHDDVTASFGSSAEIGLIDPAGADPGALAGIVEQELLDFANRRAAAGQPGFEEVSAWSAAPPLARSRAIDLVNRFMSIQFGCEVLTVELDEGATFCWARGREDCALSEPALDLALGAGNLLTT